MIQQYGWLLQYCVLGDICSSVSRNVSLFPSLSNKSERINNYLETLLIIWNTKDFSVSPINYNYLGPQQKSRCK